MRDHGPQRLWLALALAALVIGLATPRAEARFVRLSDGQRLEAAQVAAEVAGRRVVVFGETHSDPAHHAAQMEIIAALTQAGHHPAVGLEMFEAVNQDDLVRWSAGEVTEADFEPIYLDNWNLPWRLYRPIFDFARQHRLSLIALNLDEETARAVARHGLEAAGPGLAELLESPDCPPSEGYLNLLREELDSHGHGGLEFDNFRDAQLLRDRFMAQTAADFLTGRPQGPLVILTGSVHAWKPALPRQLACLGVRRVAVILPQSAGLFGPGGPTPADADYLYVGPLLEPEPADQTGPGPA